MNLNSRINISIIGAGYLGEYHIQQLKKIENINIIGFYDIDSDRASYISNKYSIAFMQVDELVDRSNAISIVTPTKTLDQGEVDYLRCPSPDGLFGLSVKPDSVTPAKLVVPLPAITSTGVRFALSFIPVGR